MNIFDRDSKSTNYVTTEDLKSLQNDIIASAKQCGSFKEAYIQHCEEFVEDCLAHGVGPDADRIDIAGNGPSVVSDLTYTNNGMAYLPRYGNAHQTFNVDKNSTGTYTMADAYGISVPFVNGDQSDFEFLFPQVNYTTNEPQILDGNYEWVQVVMSGISHAPGRKVKTWFADITGEEARARGYIKGNQKFESVFGFLKRETDITTVYVKQKMDRDDIIDISENFAIVPYMQKVMKTKLNQEIGRAILFGDGRPSASEDKIQPDKIRPIYNDDPFYCIHRIDKLANVGTTDKQKTDWMIEQSMRARKDYKGSGKPIMFTTEDWLCTMLLAQDLNGHRVYESEEQLCKALRVARIVTVDQMEAITREMNKDNLGNARTGDNVDKYVDGTASDGKTLALDAIIVNLTDYTVTTPKGGAISHFEDFDIDFNKQKYLDETRLGGACVKPFSIITIEHATT